MHENGKVDIMRHPTVFYVRTKSVKDEFPDKVTRDNSYGQTNLVAHNKFICFLMSFPSYINSSFRLVKLRTSPIITS